MADTKICAGAQVDMAVIDEEAVVGKYATIGEANDPEREEKAITVIGKGAVVAPKTVVPAGEEVRHDS
jgi:ADP-glucose pyrophosphorylase